MFALIQSENHASNKGKTAGRYLIPTQPECVFVTAASFLNIAAKTGIVNLSEIYYCEILANEQHHISP